MVTFTELDPTPRADALDTAIDNRLSHIESEKYRRSNASVLRRFAEFLRLEQDIFDPSEIAASDLREFADCLKRSVQGGEGKDDETISASSAEQYWAVASSFCGWCVREDILGENPAKLRKAKEPLPSTHDKQDQQFWTERERDAICTTATARVDEVLDDGPSALDRVIAFRDRALVYVLSYSACRASELAAVSGDDHRTGLRWRDIDLDTGTLDVLGKSRKREEPPLLDAAHEPLRALRDQLQPRPDWPVFPTGSLANLYKELPDDHESSAATIWQDLRDAGATPRSITTTTVRNILERLCEESEYEFEEVLKPHGARRGLGGQIYEQDPVAAQDVLRHSSIEITNRAYRDQKAKDTKQRAEDALDSSG